MLVMLPPKVALLTAKVLKPGMTPPTAAGATTESGTGCCNKKRSPWGDAVLVVNPCVVAGIRICVQFAVVPCAEAVPVVPVFPWSNNQSVPNRTAVNKVKLQIKPKRRGFGLPTVISPSLIETQQRRFWPQPCRETFDVPSLTPPPKAESALSACGVQRGIVGMLGR